MYAFLCESVFSSPSMTSLVLEQVFASLPCQQVTSSSTALSTLAEPSMPVITDSTWEEYQQAQTHNNNTEQHFSAQHLSKTPGDCCCVCACEEQQPAAILKLLMREITTLRTQTVSVTRYILVQSSPHCLLCPSGLYVALFRQTHGCQRKLWALHAACRWLLC